MTSDVWVVVVAAGTGTRFGEPKQFVELADERIIDRTLTVALAAAEGVVVVLPSERPDDALLPDGCVAVTGAASRSGSVRAGLAAVPPEASIILVHDGARPLASAALYERVIDAVRSGADAVVPGIEVVDSLRRRSGGPVDRTQLFAVQTPQGFAASELRRAHASGDDATDDATVVEAAGGSVVIVDGEPRNMKITEPADLAVALVLLGEESS